MNNMNQLLIINPAFFECVELEYVQDYAWRDFDTGKTLGTKVEVTIAKDNFKYNQPKDGSNAKTNLREKLTVKVPKEVSLTAGTVVKLVNPIATTYGQGMKKDITIRADDVVPVNSTSTKAHPSEKLIKGGE